MEAPSLLRQLASSTSCQEDDCYVLGFGPSAKAKELLDQLRQERGGQG